MRTTIKQFTRGIFAALLFGAGLASCTEVMDGGELKAEKSSNLTIRMGNVAMTKGGGPRPVDPLPTEVAAGIKLFAFAGQPPHSFSQQLTVNEVQGNIIKTSVSVGSWNMAMTCFRNQAATAIPPVRGVEMDVAPMFDYTNTAIMGTDDHAISNSAPEIFNTAQKVTLLPQTPATIDGILARNVAMVELVITRASIGLNKNAAAGSHKVYLDNVPKTISYGGKLLRSTGAGAYVVDAETPDVLAAPLEGRFVLSDHATESGYLQSDVVRFIIPAHQGNDFWTRDVDGTVTDINDNPSDTLKLKMKVGLDLEYADGTRYQKTVEIPRVAVANQILRVSMSVRAGVEISTEVLNWNYISIDEETGQPKSSWVYVKKDATGTGLSWSDAVGSINDGITKAQALKAAGLVINGVLIAGGESRVYEEDIKITSGEGGIHLYGGWEGVPGTELTQNDNPANPRLPHSSLARRLTTHKAIVKGEITMNDKLLYIDGFRFTGITQPFDLALRIDPAAKGLVANAIEIVGNSSYAVIAAEKNGVNPVTITNLLIADNIGSTTKIVLEYSNVTYINATFARNSEVDIAAGTFINTAVWSNGTTRVRGGTLTNCAGDHGSFSNNINSDNTGYQGPFFNVDATSPSLRYTITSNKSGLLDIGNNDVWTNPLTGITELYGIYNDINGNYRILGTVDVGCSEYPIFAGPTCTFLANDGTGRIISMQRYTPNTIVPFPADPVRTGYIFAGWFDAATGGNQYTGLGITMPSNSITVYAHWSANNSIVYNGNGHDGGDVPPNSAPVSNGVNVLVADRGTMTRTGYYFVGWTENADGSGKIYTPEGSTNLLSYVTNTIAMREGGIMLYALWTNQILPYITLAPNGGLALATSQSDPALLFKHGSVIGLHQRGNGDTYSNDDLAFNPILYPSWPGPGDPIPFTNYRSIQTFASPSMPANTENNVLRKGWGDPCKLIGFTIQEIQRGAFDNYTYEMQTETERYQPYRILRMGEAAPGMIMQSNEWVMPTKELWWTPISGSRDKNGTSNNVGTAYEDWAGYSATAPHYPLGLTMYTHANNERGTVSRLAWNPGNENARVVRCKRKTGVIHSIVYDGNGHDGGTVPPSETSLTPYTFVPVAPAGTMTRSGYYFAGWSKTAQSTPPLYSSNTLFRDRDKFPFNGGVITLYAHWVKNDEPENLGMRIVLGTDGNLALSSDPAVPGLLFKQGSLVGIHSKANGDAYSPDDVAYDPRTTSVVGQWSDIPTSHTHKFNHDERSVQDSGIGDPCALIGITKAEIRAGHVHNYGNPAVPSYILTGHPMYYEYATWEKAGGVWSAFVGLNNDVNGVRRLIPAYGYRGRNGVQAGVGTEALIRSEMNRGVDITHPEQQYIMKVTHTSSGPEERWHDEAFPVYCKRFTPIRVANPAAKKQTK